MHYKNTFLEIELTHYANEPYSSYDLLTDEVIAKGMIKYLRRYYKWDGKWENINVQGGDRGLIDFVNMAGITSSRFYSIFREVGEDRVNKFLSYFKEHNNVEAKYKHGYLTLIDLQHPKNIK